MTTANNPNNNLSPWQPGQSGNPSGRPKGTRDLAGYVLETTDGGRELVDVLATSKSGTLLLRRDQGEMAVFWDSRSRRL